MKRGVLARFARDCACCACRISLKIGQTIHYLLLHIVTLMLQPSKNARGSQKSRKEVFWRASRAIVRARTGSAWKFDQLSTTYCHTATFMLQPSKVQGEARNCKEAFRRASHATVHAACAVCTIVCEACQNASIRDFWLPLAFLRVEAYKSLCVAISSGQLG